MKVKRERDREEDREKRNKDDKNHSGLNLETKSKNLYISYLFQGSPKEREHFLEILKMQVDDIILPWVADWVPMYWGVPMS